MPDQMTQLQKDVADVQRSLAAVKQSQTEIGQKVSALETKVGSGDSVKRTEVADVKATMDELWAAARVCRMANVMRPYIESSYE